ncbi:MAG: MurR/RpiR family transcriptional regulator [Marivivens sp.]|uniref:MurR/RpiR family transcriptional regulator n=1 Tax=Marivivens sp. TaxID=1978374 RepID=UPI00185C0F1F|nr:MurR/RpiR family transcriptional regulator [Marivivens sp.]NVJ95760.1 MurR/RpiR family transcriptional regulator [Marivivens sp.]
MSSFKSPKDYEELIRVIHERYDEMSKTYQNISIYLTQNPNDVAVHSVNAIAAKCGIHASSFVRFAQSLGYKGFKELQALFQRRLATAAPGFEARRKALDEELQKRDKSELGFLRELVVQDIASLQDMLETIDTSSISNAAKIIDTANTVYLVGQLRSAPVVELLRYILTMLGKRCVLLDTSGGLATHMARTIQSTDALIAVSFRFYANEVVNIVEEIGQMNVPIIAITDSTLSPLAKTARVLFPVPEHDHAFSRSLAAPICLAQALAVAVAALKQTGEDTPRIPTVTAP